MRHADYRGLEKNARTIDDEYQGLSARSIDDPSYYPLSPSTSDHFMIDGSGRREHSLSSFVAIRPKRKGKNNKSTATTNKSVEGELVAFEENEKDQRTRGRLTSRESLDTQFDMEPDGDTRNSKIEGKAIFSLNK